MKPFKALILGILLLVPILIFIFISVFGTHHFSLKTYYPKLDDAGGVVYNAAGDTVFQQMPFFELKSTAGESITQTDLDSNLYVASYFSLPCADSCQKVFSQLVRVQEVFANNPELKIVSIAVNASPDTLQVLEGLSQKFSVKDKSWYLLSGDEAAIQNATKIPGDSITSQKLLLVDKQKHIRGVYDGTDTEDVDRLILEINVLLDEYSKRK